MKEPAQQAPLTGLVFFICRILSRYFSRLPLVVFILSLFPLFLVQCGGKKRTPSVVTIPVGVPTSSRSVVQKSDRIPRIRILLKENFRSILVEGSKLGPKVFVYADARKIRLENARKKLLKVGSGFRLEPRQGKLLRLDGLTYRGALEIFINPLRQSVIVNDIDIEAYLKGVIVNEMSPGLFPQAEAIKAQSIAARTFAKANLGQHARRGFDLYDDERSQVYRGERSETSLGNRVIQQTQGMLVTYRDKPIIAFYSSTCGGLTENSQAAFKGSEIPYLKGGVKCPDKFSPYRLWSHRISASDVQGNLNRLIRLGRLRKLVTLRKSQTGRTIEMKFVGSKGGEVIRRSNIRRALGIRSNWITNLDPRYDGSGYVMEIEVRGRGWGHGVGLCQMGAVELARKGWSHKRILKHYYPGIDLSRHW